MHDLEVITSNLRRLMNQSGLNSQSRLAAAAGISQTNLSNIMRHTVMPQLDTLTNLARALNVETWQLLAPREYADFLRLFSSASQEDQDTILRIARSLVDLPDKN